MDEKSPRGRVKVARAGAMTRVLAVARTLPEVAAKGRATTNTTEPTIVAKKQPGRASVTSPTTMSGSCDEARLVLIPPRLTKQTQMTVSNFSFIISLSKEHCTCGVRLSSYLYSPVETILLGA